jgi:hypothetical protein
MIRFGQASGGIVSNRDTLGRTCSTWRSEIDGERVECSFSLTVGGLAERNPLIEETAKAQ